MRAVPKDAKRYAELAAWAHHQGYPDITASRIESWVRRGLLPRAEIAHTGFGRREIRDPPDTQAALLRACRYRFDWRENSIAIIGVAMWIDGFDVTEKLVREGLRREATAPIRLLRVIRKRPDVRPHDAVDAAAVAAVDEEKVFLRYNPAGVSEEQAVSWKLTFGVAAWLSLLVDPSAEVSDEDLVTFGRVLGMDAPAGVADSLRDVARSLRPANLGRRISRAQYHTIEDARAQAVALLASAGDPASQHPEFKALVLLAWLAVGDRAHSA